MALWFATPVSFLCAIISGAFLNKQIQIIVTS